jgi:2-oxoglutarate dehydrogenase complex dehydrogenase (E1) component-like enzyme
VDVIVEIEVIQKETFFIDAKRSSFCTLIKRDSFEHYFQISFVGTKAWCI